MTGSHRLYVGTIGEGLFRSLDAGETFVRACDGMFVECHVRALAADPRNPPIIFLGCEHGLFKTYAGANHWSGVESPFDGRRVWCILLAPNQPDVIVVGTCPAGLFLSEDGGRSWRLPAARMLQNCPRIMHTRVTCLLADPEEAGTLYAGVEIDGIFRSRDSGKTWEPVGQGLSSRDIHALAFATAGNGRRNLLAATNNDLNISTD